MSQKVLTALSSEEVVELIETAIRKYGEDRHPESVLERYMVENDFDFDDDGNNFGFDTDHWDDQGKYQLSTATVTINGLEYYWSVSRSGSYYTEYYYSNDADVQGFDPLEAKVIVQYHEDFGRMGSLDSTMVMTKRQLKGLSDCVGLDEVLGKHSYVEADFANNTTIVSEDPAAVQVVVELFGHHCMGIDLLES